MKNITQQFNTGFEPFKALLIYKHEKEAEINQFQRNEEETQIYVESYDIGKDGRPINAHPLTLKEMTALHALLQTSPELQDTCLKSKGLLPNKVLYVNQQANGFAVWYTPPQEVTLFFVDGLHIPSGKFPIPAMLWKANADTLCVYAVKGKTKPHENTKLCHAPYLNIYGSGQVCMGTVQINIGKSTCLEDFMATWERYFFNSNFSHSISGNNSTKTNTTDLWRSLTGSTEPFPQEELLTNHLTLKQLIR
ncbi:PRTRC system protein B [Mucilaginibacter sp. cycad4]|uniref:PRTRC system protein B n=1 Tax=Mucilaginibacter sp. cycad4 TaxID=3342096 RepID=UPI002AAB0FA0|nr:PRTRC system protein B [Mucilaginibacter gossypii]WPU98442.1 PRTRC system protein B [Mucilaginibacter gossypii]